jgi:hypothetical protein
MSPDRLVLLIQCLIAVSVVLILCATYAYHVNARRAPDDPNKRKYHPFAIVLAPITFPLLFVLSIFFFLLRVLAYAVFLVLFVLALLLVRQPFILVWLRKTASNVGDRLLEANTRLVIFLLSPWRNYQGSV